MAEKIIDFEAKKAEAEVAGLPFRPDDDQIALHIAEEWKQRFTHFHGAWKECHSGYWQERHIQEIRVHLRKLLRAYKQYGIQVNQRRISSLAQMLEDDLFVSDRIIIEQQTEQKRYINLRNGLFNLETFELEPHRPELYFTSQLDFEYDESALCPTFLDYLNSSLVLPDGSATDWKLTQMVCQALAYSMTARTDLKASFWLVGKPDSGKSTFIAFLRGLMGELHATIDLNQMGKNRFLLAGIIGKRVVTFTEASSNTMLDDALYKAMVGGSDEIYADVKNRPAIAFKPESKFWWAMNEAPRISDRSGATFNRLYIIPFNRTIPREQRIPNLENLLIAERAGIFNHIMSLYQRLVRSGKFDHVEQSVNLRAEYQLENDTEATYINEKCMRGAKSRVQSSVLYAEYRAWCDTNGFKPKNANQVAREWERLGLAKQVSDGRVFWWGISLL